MDHTAVRLNARHALVTDAFWDAAGTIDGGWQTSVEDWRPGRGVCERCGRPANVIAVIVHPGGRRVERLAEDCLTYAGLPPAIVAATTRGLRAARTVGRHLDTPTDITAADRALTDHHPGIRSAIDAGFGIPDRWRRHAKAARAHTQIEQALRHEGLPATYAPAIGQLATWWEPLRACPGEWEARRRAAAIIPVVLDGDGTTRQAVMAAKLITTPWALIAAANVPASWTTWGVWPAELPATMRPATWPSVGLVEPCDQRPGLGTTE